MRVAAIICEYNPFHYGHKYHIEQVRKQTGADRVMCIMSGSFVQRGEVAITDKWQRAKTALQNGADLVLELPCYFVLQSAENFAYGGVLTANSTKIVDYLCFGSESGNIDKLLAASDLYLNPTVEFTDTIKNCLDKGLGYPTALDLAYKKSGFENSFGANDILGISYINAIKKLNSGIEPVAIERTNDYHSENTDTGFLSATAVRKLVFDNKDISDFVPSPPLNIYNTSSLENYILAFFRSADQNTLCDILGMEEGLASRLIKCALTATSLDEFINDATTKRYTSHRIKRVISCCLLNIKKGFECDYIRVLAANKKGTEMLSEIKKKSDVSIITKTADFNFKSNSTFKFDLLSTDIAALCSDNPKERAGGKDYTVSPVILSD